MEGTNIRFTGKVRKNYASVPDAPGTRPPERG